MSTPYGRLDAPLNPGAAPTRERGIGELFADLSDQTATLIRNELKLARTEITQKATIASRQLAFIATGALLATLGLLLLLISLVAGLSAYMPLWVSALVVGLVVSAIAAGLAFKGVTTLQQTELKPEQTLRSIEANKSILQGQAK